MKGIPAHTRARARYSAMISICGNVIVCAKVIMLSLVWQKEYIGLGSSFSLDSKFCCTNYYIIFPPKVRLIRLCGRELI